MEQVKELARQATDTLRGQSANVGDAERVATGVAGGALAIWGLRRGGLIGTLSALTGAGLALRAATGYCPAYARMEMSDEERKLASDLGWKTAAMTRQTVTIARPREEIYRFWRDFSNLPRFMPHVKRLVVLSNDHSHWEVRIPMGGTVQWNSTITEDRPNERIAWKADQEADVRNAGWVEFRDATTGGTEVEAMIAYEPPGGPIGHLLARVWGDKPGMLAREDLQHLKRMMESGQAAYPGPEAARSTSETRPGAAPGV